MSKKVEVLLVMKYYQDVQDNCIMHILSGTNRYPVRISGGKAYQAIWETLPDGRTKSLAKGRYDYPNNWDNTGGHVLKTRRLKDGRVRIYLDSPAIDLV